MSVLNINSSSIKIVKNIGRKSDIDYSFLADKGDVLEGKVEQNGKVVINIDGEDIVVNNANTSKSKVGDTKRYEVLESSKNKLVLKELEENTGVNEKIDINKKINPKEMKISYETQEIKQSVAKTNETLVDTEMEEELTKKLDKTIATLSPEDIRAIEEDGKSIEEMDIKEIYNKISKLKREKRDNSEHNCGKVDKIVDNSLRSTGNIYNNVDNLDNFDADGDIVRKNMPKVGIIIENTNFKDKINEKIRIKYFDEEQKVTDELPKEVGIIVDELFNENNSGCITKDSIKYIMQNELDHTLDNIYKAKYAGSTVITHNISDEDFAQLSEQVEEVIEQSGYEVNDENIAIAKWIIESDIAFTKDTFEEYFELQEINKYTKDDMSVIVNDYVTDDVPIEDMYISYVEKDEVEEVVNGATTITDEAIGEVIKNNEVINLKNLLISQKSIDEQLANNPNIKVEGNKKENTHGRTKYLNLDEIMGNLDEMEKGKETKALTIRTRRQLEEIRLKLTIEAGNKLALKGFNIATEELSSVVTELTNIEQAYNNKYDNALKDNYEGQKLFDETISTVFKVNGMSGYVLAATYPIRDKITIAGLYEEGNKTDYRAYDEVGFKVNRNMDRFNETFETIMTAPRKDMGDSIDKAFRNVDEILTDMGLELTSLNQRAVRILGYNNTEITKENIASVKLYDYEVNSVLNELTPAAVVELIKADKNPLNMTLEELSEELIQIKANNVSETDDDYSKYLWKLDKQSKLSPKERDAYIGIYRLIHQVEKSDGAVIGAIMNSGKELTLRNLLIEARVRQNKGINVNIDDLFGAIETVTRKDKAIDKQIESVFTENELTLNKKIYSDISKKITPEAMSNAITDKVDIMNMPIEKVLQYIEEQKSKEDAIDKEYYEYKLNLINEVADNTNKAIKLLSGLGMETTMNNVIAASDTVFGNGMGNLIKKLTRKQDSDSNTWLDEGSIETIEDAKKSLLDIASNIVDVLDERDKLNYTYTELEENVKSIVNAYKDNYQNSDLSIEELRNINRNISFVTSMSRKECYEIPLITSYGEDEINVTNVNLTIIRNSNKQEVSVNFNSELLGRVEAKFTYKNNSFKGLILGDSSQAVEMLKNNYASLKESVVKEDITLKQLDYGINNKINYTFSGKNNNAKEAEISTKKLYSLSKALLMNIKETEEQVLARG